MGLGWVYESSRGKEQPPNTKRLISNSPRSCDGYYVRSMQNATLVTRSAARPPKPSKSWQWWFFSSRLGSQNSQAITYLGG